MLPEYALQKAIISGIHTLREDPKALDLLFGRLGRANVQAIKDFLKNTPIDFSINYPKQDLKAPAIILLLKNESEQNAFLGDIMGAPNDTHFPDFEFSYETDAEGVLPSEGPLEGPPPAITGAIRVDPSTSTASRIYVTEASQAELEAVMQRTGVDSVLLDVVRGTGRGRSYQVQRMSKEYVDIFGTFEVDLDSTSVVVLRDSTNSPATDGEPQEVYDASNRGLLRKGAQYQVQYQLTILGSRQEEVLYLYNMLKAIFFLSRVYLEGQGLHNLQISGTDFAPKSEYLPDVVYTRSMQLSFISPFYVYAEQDVLDELRLCITPTDLFAPDGSVPFSTIIRLEP